MLAVLQIPVAECENKDVEKSSHAVDWNCSQEGPEPEAATLTLGPKRSVLLRTAGTLSTLRH